MSILKVARMGHPVLRAEGAALDRGEIKQARRPEADRRHDRDDGRVSRRRSGGARRCTRACGCSSRRSIDDDDGEAPSEPVAIINPEITPVGTEVVEDWEGCLSIPDIRGRVPRAREIKVRAFDRDGERIELRAHDLPARVIQHETDHLDGILFFDRMRSFESLTFLDEYSRYWVKD